MKVRKRRSSISKRSKRTLKTKKERLGSATQVTQTARGHGKPSLFLTDRQTLIWRQLDDVINLVNLSQLFEPLILFSTCTFYPFHSTWRLSLGPFTFYTFRRRGFFSDQSLSRKKASNLTARNFIGFFLLWFASSKT